MVKKSRSIPTWQRPISRAKEQQLVRNDRVAMQPPLRRLQLLSPLWRNEMSSALCLTLRFLDSVPRFHGRGDDGNPEWPPSPLRFFQALVSAAATRWRE